MGEGGKIIIKNSTPQDFIKVAPEKSYQMESFTFPATIPSGSESTPIYVEWSNRPFKTASDDSGEVEYRLGSSEESFKLKYAEIDDDKRLVVDWNNVDSSFGTAPGRDQRLHQSLWVHDGTRTIEISRKSPLCLSVLSWNTDKDGTGRDGKAEQKLDGILSAFGDTVPIPDVVLLQEMNEGNLKSYKEHFQQGTPGYSWAYVAANEDDREAGNANAVLSKYPITAQGVIRFQKQCGWRGRNAVWADIAVPGQPTIRIYSVHLEIGKLDEMVVDLLTNNPEIDAAKVRIQQFLEVKAHAAAANALAIIGGDFNGTDIGDYQIDGYLDCHQTQRGARFTCDDGKRGYRRLDYILVSDRIQQDVGKVYPAIGRKCGWVSDHCPVMATITLGT